MTPAKHHSLIVRSLHDIDARCSCGEWFLSGGTVDTESDGSLYYRVRQEYILHLHHVIDKYPKDGLTVPPENMGEYD